MKPRLLLAIAFCSLVAAQSERDRKLIEIDAKIADTDHDLQALRSLRDRVADKTIEDGALRYIMVPGPCVTTTPRAAVIPASVPPSGAAKLATPAQAGGVIPEADGATKSAATAATPASGTPTGQTTASGQPTYVGPRGGVYHYSASGKKVYQKRK